LCRYTLDATFFNAHVPNPHVQTGGANRRGKQERLQSHGGALYKFWNPLYAYLASAPGDPTLGPIK
jgi:hypothetical protein